MRPLTAYCGSIWFLQFLSFNLSNSFVCGWFPRMISFCLFTFINQFFHLAVFLHLVMALSFLPREVPLTCLVKLIWYWTLTFCLSVKLSISPLDLSESLVRDPWCLWAFFPSYFKILSWKWNALFYFAFLINLIKFFLSCSETVNISLHLRYCLIY